MMGVNEEKQIWRFTFGCGKQHDGYCKPILGTFSSAREKMFELYGGEWCLQYSENEWNTIKNDPRRFWPVEKELQLVEA